MFKKIFDTNKMKNSGSSNIEYRTTNIELVIWYSKSCIKVSFDIKILIFGLFPNAKEGFDPNKMINSGSLNIEYRTNFSIWISNIECRISN